MSWIIIQDDFYSSLEVIDTDCYSNSQEVKWFHVEVFATPTRATQKGGGERPERRARSS